MVFPSHFLLIAMGTNIRLKAGVTLRGAIQLIPTEIAALLPHLVKVSAAEELEVQAGTEALMLFCLEVR